MSRRPLAGVRVLECGIALASYQDIQAGDKIECFEIEAVARQL